MIEIENLRKSYGSNKAVDGISFSLSAGQVLAFLGPNGAGKSTTMKILTGSLAPDGGTAKVGGFDVMKRRAQAQAIIGYLPEHNPLYDEMAVVDFLEFVASTLRRPKAERRALIARAARSCGLSERLHQSIGSLSKGYRQRVGLAQALARDPKVLILDEPTGGLDPNQRRDILELIREAGTEKTVIHSTHLLDEVRQTSDRTIVIHRGRIVADGSPREIARAASGEMTVRAVLAAPEFAARHALEGLDAVRSVERLDEEFFDPEEEARGGGGPKRGAKARAKEKEKRAPTLFRLSLKPGRDCRREVCDMAREKNWPLLELVLETPSLDHIFQRLTQG